MSKSTLFAGLLLLGAVAIGSHYPGKVFAQSAEISRPSQEQTGDYVRRLVNLTTRDGGSYVRVRVLKENALFITIEFQNLPHSIPWTEVTSIQIVGS